MESYDYKLIISYNGTAYCGWQHQSSEIASVQETICKVIYSILGRRDGINLIGASRTDARVHALGQVAKLELSEPVEIDRFIQKVNSKLPSDIKILEFEKLETSLNVNLDAISKEYHYHFSLSGESVFFENIYFLEKSLDLSIMKQACQLLVGEHDFIYLGLLRPGATNSKRMIYSCEIHDQNFENLNIESFVFKIKGKGFLKYMVRMIVFALFEVGKKNLSLADFERLLRGIKVAGLEIKKAPAKGLHLYKINY